jgi:hypothetical protein
MFNLLDVTTLKSISLVCVVLWVSPAFAETKAEPDDEDKVESKDKAEAKDKADKPEEKSGGKFTLLGRECKAEDGDELETTPGSPPLDVDDAGTPGCNGWEVNIVTSGEFGRDMSLETPLFDINYGIGDNIQLKYEIPYLINRIGGVAKPSVGLAEFGIKWRFYEDESRGLSIGVYPQLEFAVPGTAVAMGAGTTTKLPVLFSTKIGETSKGDVMITANAGYNIPTEDGAQHYVSAAFGVGFPLTANIAMMIEGSTEQALGNNMENVREASYKANLGFLGRVNKHLMWFGSVGQGFGTLDVDDSRETCMVMGVRVLAGGP